MFNGPGASDVSSAGHGSGQPSGVSHGSAVHSGQQASPAKPSTSNTSKGSAVHTGEQASQPKTASKGKEVHSGQQASSPTKPKSNTTSKGKEVHTGQQANPARDVVNKVSSSAKDKAKSIIRDFEKFRSKSYWDVNAWRAGFGSDTYTTADGVQHKVTKNSVVTKDDAERDLTLRTNEFYDRARTQIGAERFDRLSTSAQAGLTSVAYNYGSLPKTVVAAARTGNANVIAASVSALKSNTERRKQEAAYISGNAAIASNTPGAVQNTPAPIPRSKPSLPQVVAEIPFNLPFGDLVKRGLDIIKQFSQGKTPSPQVGSDFIREAVPEIIGGIVPGWASPFVNGAIREAEKMPGNKSGDLWKFATEGAGALIGGPFAALGIGTLNGAIDSAKTNNAPSKTNVASPSPTGGNPADTGNPFTSRAETAHTLLTAAANGASMSPGGMSYTPSTISPASETGAKSIWDALGDPAYNPLNVSFWQSASWSIAIIVMAVSLILFGSYVMLTKPNHPGTNLTLVTNEISKAA